MAWPENHLKEYFVTGKKDFFEVLPEDEWPYVLYQRGSDWMTFKEKNHKTVNDYVISILKDDTKKFSGFLMKFVNSDFSSLNNIDNFKRIYDLESFKQIAEEFKDSKLLNNDEKKIINTFLDSFLPQEFSN